ncbi:hypothetical protein ACHAPU_000125 [Fusarium lateritium]
MRMKSRIVHVLFACLSFVVGRVTPCLPGSDSGLPVNAHSAFHLLAPRLLKPRDGRPLSITRVLHTQVVYYLGHLGHPVLGSADFNLHLYCLGLIFINYIGTARVIQFNNENWVTVSESILHENPRFLTLWKDKQVLDMPNIPYHVAHVVIHYLNTKTYQSLKLKSPSANVRNLTDFSSAIYVYCIGAKYNLPDLSRLVSERITIYGDRIDFVQIVKRLSEPPFAGMAITGALYEYITYRTAKDC